MITNGKDKRQESAPPEASAGESPLGVCSWLFRSGLADLERDLPRHHPLRLFLAEHGLIRRLADRLDELCQALAAGAPDDQPEILRQIHDTAAELRVTSRHHHEREEKALFPALERHGLKAPTGQLLDEHQIFRRHEDALLRISEKLIAEPSGDFTPLFQSASSLIALSRSHIHRENGMLIPLAMESVASGALGRGRRGLTQDPEPHRGGRVMNEASQDALWGFDPDLIRRHDRAGPRYTSYPAAPFFKADVGADDVITALREREPGPISLYVHLPFCPQLCWYCGCHKVISKDPRRIDSYLDDVERELDLQAAALDGSSEVAQLHWGGGSPSALDDAQAERLMTMIGERFPMAQRAEVSIEGDPRQLDAERLATFRRIGFNRLSLGLQDFDEQVQRTVNRIQDDEATLQLIRDARRLGFGSVSVDLIYGLPFQTVETFDRTLARVLEAAPDRLSIFNYAHLPALFPAQKLLPEEMMPGPEEKLAIFGSALLRLADSGWMHIGMDHFARRDDELALAADSGGLQRNFQGYSTHAGLDMLSFGVSAIAQIGSLYAQNMKGLRDYRETLKAGKLPIERGLHLDAEDRLRHRVIMDLMCGNALSIAAVEKDFDIDFRKHFATELEEMKAYEEDGLVRVSAEGIEVLPAGRFLVRNVARVFDARLRASREKRFSKVI